VAAILWLLFLRRSAGASAEVGERREITRGTLEDRNEWGDQEPKTENVCIAG